MGSNNRLASPQGASSPPGGGYSQTLNINDAQGPAPTPPWGGSAPQISSPTPMPAPEVRPTGGSTPLPPLPAGFNPASGQEVMKFNQTPPMQNFNAPRPMMGGGFMPMGNSGFMPMYGGGYGGSGGGFMGMPQQGSGGGFMGMPQQRYPTCGK